jgi:hypothetical protein
MGADMDRKGLKVGLFRPEDAEGVAKLFREIYGHEYPAKIVYQPDDLIKAFEQHEQIPVVVRTADDRVVGYSSLFRVAPDKGVYEKGNGAVAMDFRDKGVMGLIFSYVGETFRDIPGIKVFFGEPVCNHVYIQKSALASLPFVETAVEIDLMPAQAYVKEESASGRVSTLPMFITVIPGPHTVHVPEGYEEAFAYIYGGLDDRRSLSPSKEGLPPSRQTRIETEVYDSAQVARMTVHEAGADFEKAFLSEEKRTLSRNVEVIQVFLKLSWPWVAGTISVLKRNAYFLGGIMPQWFGEDGLLMQKTVSRPNWEGIHLFSERANRILEFIKADYQS